MLFLLNAGKLVLIEWANPHEVFPMGAERKVQKYTLHE